jgi:hypothetical protein
MEGMNAPMGNYKTYGHQARAVTVVDRSLKEVEPGVYAGKVRIPLISATQSTGRLPPVPGQSCHPSERSDAGRRL